MVVEGFFDSLVASVSSKSLVSKKDLSLSIIYFQNFDFHFVTWLCNGVKIDGRIVGIFVFGKNTIGFVSDIQDDLIWLYIDYSSLYDLSIVNSFK